jgi:hypothetical protein
MKGCCSRKMQHKITFMKALSIHNGCFLSNKKLSIYGPGEVWHLTSLAQRNRSSSMLPVSTKKGETFLKF